MGKMIRLRQEIEAIPVNDIEDQQVKAYMLADAEAIAARSCSTAGRG